MLMLFTRKTYLRFRVLIDLLMKLSFSSFYRLRLGSFFSFQRNLLHFFHFVHQFLKLLLGLWLCEFVLLFLMIPDRLIDGIALPGTTKLFFSAFQKLLIFCPVEELIWLGVHSVCIGSVIGEIMILLWKLFHLLCMLSLALFPLGFWTNSILFCCFKHFFLLEPNLMLNWLCL